MGSELVALSGRSRRGLRRTLPLKGRVFKILIIFMSKLSQK